MLAASAPQGRLGTPLCSRSSSFVAMQQGLRCRGPLVLPRAARRPVCAAASAAQPLLRAASRLVVRTLPAQWLAAAFGAARRWVASCVG